MPNGWDGKTERRANGFQFGKMIGQVVQKIENLHGDVREIKKDIKSEKKDHDGIHKEMGEKINELETYKDKQIGFVGLVATIGALIGWGITAIINWVSGK